MFTLLLFGGLYLGMAVAFYAYLLTTAQEGSEEDTEIEPADDCDRPIIVEKGCEPQRVPFSASGA
ncbi:MAG TPA: hypothetical protein VFB38_17030 [Chthonomonadaceae bacterium]|nr:hypothetical protein [Chthonomonadaceae bacterium]